MTREKKRAAPKPPPVLKVQIKGEMDDLNRMVDLMAQVLGIASSGSEGAVGRKTQFLSSLINAYSTGFRFEDPNGTRRAVGTFSSAVAAARHSAVMALRETMTRPEVGDLIGLTSSGIQAIEQRAEGTRARQERITLKDAARLKAAKEADRFVAPAAVEEPLTAA